MFAIACSQCAAQLSVTEGQGSVRCGSCGANTVVARGPFAPPMFAPGAMPHASGPQPTVCSGCHIENPPGIRFCRKCGNVLPPPGANASPPSPFGPGAMPSASQPAAQAWGCPECRRENPPHYEFCLGCGAARRLGGAPVQRGDGYPAQRVETPKRGAKVLIVVLIVVGIILLTIVGEVAYILATSNLVV